MVAIILGPSIGLFLFRLFDSDFALASWRLSTVTFVFTALFFVIFMLPSFFQEESPKSEESVDVEEEVEAGIRHTLSEIQPVKELIAKVQKISKFRENLQYLSNYLTPSAHVPVLLQDEPGHQVLPAAQLRELQRLPHRLHLHEPGLPAQLPRSQRNPTNALNPRLRYNDQTRSCSKASSPSSGCYYSS